MEGDGPNWLPDQIAPEYARGDEARDLPLSPVTVSDLSDVFTVEEIARAAGVPLEAAHAVLQPGSVRSHPVTALFSASEAVRAGVEARRAIRSCPTAARDSEFALFAPSQQTPFAVRRGGLPSFASSMIHGVFVFTMLLLASGAPESAPADGRAPRLVFMAHPGPAGGGGGGLRSPLPTRTADTAAPIRRPQPARDASLNRTPERPQRLETPVPAPAPVPAPKPALDESLPSRRLVAPVAPATAGLVRTGAVHQSSNETVSRGSGEGGGAEGRGAGNGEGFGAGGGPGNGGGIGGGPYRAGSGIEPPRLIREIKARYTDEARRRGTTGNVVLEIVITRDGAVGAVAVRRGLGDGLDQRAIDAVGQWRFAPARRLGEPVDVIVEVAVEFMLR